jgi:hypothetical protein
MYSHNMNKWPAGNYHNDEIGLHNLNIQNDVIYPEKVDVQGA